MPSQSKPSVFQRTAEVAGQLALACVQLGSDHLRRWRLQSCSGQPLSVFRNPWTRFFFFQMYFLFFSLSLLPLVMPLGITEKNLLLSSLFHPIRNLDTLIRTPLRLLFSRLEISESLRFSWMTWSYFYILYTFFSWPNFRGSFFIHADFLTLFFLQPFSCWKRPLLFLDKLNGEISLPI